MNAIKTFLLLAGLTALFLFIGGALGGRGGMESAFIFACIMNLGSYWFSDKIVLAMYRARPVSETEAPELVRIVKMLAVKANIPTPKVYIIDSDVPNAFATGRNPEHAAVAATTGILNILDDDELEGVLGHELSHVFHRDILISSLAATLAGAIMMLANMARWGMMFGGFGGRDREERGGGLELLVVAILAPLAASLIQLAISRSREYDADRGGAELTQNPLSLARALQKISDGNMHARVPLTTNPATAHLFITNPLRGEGLMALFSTHPPTAERIRRLEEMAAKMSPYHAPRIVY
ncbi:MAG TPA: zinc metalloprotease HtpX [Elusimicrobiota bacterium]|nr:zinc metalloprotease HtpX [Elusimicrobiota bacterium]